MSVQSAGDGSEVVVIWNSGAGSSGHADDVRRTLAETPGVQVVDTRSREDALRTVREACAGGAQRIIAAGGDGTVNAAVSALAAWQQEHGGSPPLAVLPLGTGNDLARSLGMPLTPMEAVDICLRGTVESMDVLELESGDGQVRIAGNMITAGNTGKYMDILTDDLKQRWGALCYLRGAVDLLEDLDVFKIRLEIDATPPVQVDALNLFFANGRTSGGGMTVCSDASLNDGQLQLLVIREGTGFDLAGLTVDYLTSDVRENDLVLHRACKRVRVTCSDELPLSADGDAAKSRDFTVSVRPAAIRVVAATTDA